MNNQLNCVVDALPAIVWTASVDGEIDFLNQRWCDYTGLDPVQSCGRGWQVAIHPDDKAALLDGWHSTLTCGQSRDVEVRLRRFDGVYRWFLFSTSPLPAAPGQASKWCGISTDIEDRKQAEDALVECEHYYRSIAECIPALLALMSPTGKIESINRHGLDYFGRTPDDLENWMLTDIVHPDDLPSVISAWRRSVETGAAYDIEHRMRRADGVYRWFHVRGVPLRGTDGQIVRWYVLQFDIDDRKRSQALLSGEKRLLRMVARGRPLTVIITELCKLLDASAPGCSCSILLLDRTATRVQHAIAPGLPADYCDLMEGELLSCTAGPCGMAALLRTQVIVSDVETDTRWDSQGWPAVALSHGLKSCWSSPILSLNGDLLGTFAIYRREPGNPSAFHQTLIQRFTYIASITIERAQNEEALKRSAAFLTKAQHISATGSFSWHLATNEITLSEQYYRIFELDPEQPITIDLIMSRVHPDDVPLLHAMIERARHDKADFDYECRLLMPDQSIKYLQFANGAIHQKGQVEYIGAVQDITSRRLAEEALNKVRSELAHVARVACLGTLTASIAHEVNQPLSGIITNASTCLRMLAATPPNIDGALQTARRTIRDGNRAADVIARLRTLFSKKVISVEAVDLNEATREVLALTRSELQSNRVTTRLDLADHLPLVTSDRVQLQQVILNLLLNASEAMVDVHDRPRLLVIRTEHDADDCVRLIVRDEGAGFEPDDVEKLFDAFYTTKQHGMGMGLSISRSIIESHNGQLSATPNDDFGATFWFSIPRESSFDPTNARTNHLMRTV